MRKRWFPRKRVDKLDKALGELADVKEGLHHSHIVLTQELSDIKLTLQNVRGQVELANQQIMYRKYDSV